jgi:hypothetical protein
MDDDRVRWAPSNKQPNQLISLQQARQLLVESASGTALVEFVGDCPPTIGCRGEFVNMWYGGSRLRAELAERAELAKVERVQAAARDQIREHLAAKKSKFYRVEKRDSYAPIRGPLVIDEALPEFWQSSDRGYRSLQKLILERNEDPSGRYWYALDRAALMAFLDAEGRDEAQAIVNLESIEGTPIDDAQRGRRGPKPGTVDRYGEADRALFPELAEIIRANNLSPTAAAVRLAECGKVLGAGTPLSRAKRLVKRYQAR